MVMLQQVVTLMEGEWLSYGGGQFSGGSKVFFVVMLQRIVNLMEGRNLLWDVTEVVTLMEPQSSAHAYMSGGSVYEDDGNKPATIRFVAQ